MDSWDTSENFSDSQLRQFAEKYEWGSVWTHCLSLSIATHEPQFSIFLSQGTIPLYCLHFRANEAPGSMQLWHFWFWNYAWTTLFQNPSNKLWILWCVMQTNLILCAEANNLRVRHSLKTNIRHFLLKAKTILFIQARIDKTWSLNGKRGSKTDHLFAA